MGFIEPGKSTWGKRGPANRKKPRKIPNGVTKKVIKPRPAVKEVPIVIEKMIQPLIKSFQDIPSEILQRIFINAGLDSDLILLNRHFYNQLKFNLDPLLFVKDSEGHIHWQGSETVLQVIQEHFQHNLNKGMNFRKVRKKIKSLVEKLSILGSNDQVTSFQKYVDRIELVDYKVINLNVLNYRFMSAKLAELLVSRGFKFMNPNQIDAEPKVRKRYTDLKLKEMERIVREFEHNETEENTPNLDLNLTITPNENKLDSEIIMLRELVNDYKPEGNEVYFPDDFMNDNITEEKIEISMYLNKNQKIMFSNNTSVLNNLMTNYPYLFLHHYKFVIRATSDKLMDSGTKKISIYSIITLFDTVNELISSSSNESNDFNDNDNSIENWPIGIDWYAAIKFFLKTFYSHNPDIDDHLIWEGLRNTNGEIIDLITEFSNPPASFI